ncbi:MAG: hypothetical protein ACR2H3_09290 [Acidimicrobiales bacterium]
MNKHETQPARGARPRGREPWFIPAVAVFILLPIGTILYNGYRQWQGDRPPSLSRQGSRLTSEIGEADRLPLGAAPTSYEVTYRVERYDATKITVSEDRITIDRPFNSRVTALANGKVISERASRLGALVISTGVGNRSLVSPPSIASADLRFDAVLEEAIADGLAEVREQRTVLLRRCQVYRVGGSVQAGELVPVGTTEGAHSDICIDEVGLLLEEVWFDDGRPLLRRVATSVAAPAEADDGRFSLDGEEAISYADGNGYFEAIDPASGFEGKTFRLPDDALPPGFTYEGRFAVQPPRLSPFGNNPLDEDRPREQVSQVDVWVRGADVIILTQVIAADIAAVPSNPSVATEVDLGPALGMGLGVLDFRLNDVRVEGEPGRFLRLSGSLNRAELAALARRLVAEQTAGIVPLGAEPVPG